MKGVTKRPYWRWADSNRRPLPCEGSALPAKLHPPQEFYYKLNLPFSQGNKLESIIFLTSHLSYHLFINCTKYRNRQVSIHLTSLSLSGLLRKIYDPVTMKSVITEYTVLYLFKL